jgi:hypothetical protein
VGAAVERYMEKGERCCGCVEKRGPGEDSGKAEPTSKSESGAAGKSEEKRNQQFQKARDEWMVRDDINYGKNRNQLEREKDDIVARARDDIVVRYDVVVRDDFVMITIVKTIVKTVATK